MPGSPRRAVREPPPARDPNVSRPFLDTDTARLIEQARDVNDQIDEHRIQAKELARVRREMFLELERRHMSYRAMAKAIGISNPQVGRIVREV